MGDPDTGPRGAGVIRRGKLLDRLSAAGPGGVTLICAPAGSGKTMLVRSWIEAAGLEDRIGWVSVERDERDAQRFWLAVNAALADAGGIVQRLDPAPSFRGEAFVEKLLADLRALEEPVALVIDDLHELRSAQALRCLEDFLAALPSELRVFLLSREDPGLGLHRLRLAGQLTELRDADLRFTPEETEELLRASNVALPHESARLLYERTEGWAAGLRLAAISLEHLPDPERFVTEFSGSERTVARYLLEEVLERQPPEVRQLLLRTSILDRVSGPLADRLTGGSGSERILQELEDANAFVNSLDVTRSWFRYHHLFADLLQLELRRIDPEAVGPLHRAAAAWHEENGNPVEAVRHAQAADDWPHAARLLTTNDIGLILDGRLATVRALLEAFPPRLGAVDPELALAFADVRLRDGAADDAATYIADAERSAATVPEVRRGAFEMQLASVKLESASRRGELERTREAMRALERALLTQTAGTLGQSHDVRALALMSLGITELWALEVDDARRHLEEALALARRIGRPYLEIGCLADLAIAAPLSELSAADALQFSEQAAATAEVHGLEADPVAALAFAVGAGTLAWLGRFDEAEQWLARAQRALRPGESPGTELAAHHARGLLMFGQGRLADALDAFRRAETMQAMLSDEHALMVDLRMRIVLTQVRMGELQAAKDALERIADHGLDRAEARIPAAAVELAEERPEPAIEQLAPVIEQTAPTLHRRWAAVHALLFDALARAQLRDAGAREQSLERALELAELEGLILPFATAPVEDLLREHPAHRTAHATFIAEILDVLSGGSPRRRGDHEAQLDELSEAELRVMRYLPTNLKAPEIAAELFVSTNTVRTHLRHIYAKLGAHGRAEAVARARDLHLLGPSSRVR
ncbi:MAG: LuxR C-terminal-related transcriptional regulator [Solirubrobacteraceae bacterium]